MSRSIIHVWSVRRVMPRSSAARVWFQTVRSSASMARARRSARSAVIPAGGAPEVALSDGTDGAGPRSDASMVPMRRPAALSTPSRQNSTLRMITLRSSRTLPAHGWARRRAAASGARVGVA